MPERIDKTVLAAIATAVANYIAAEEQSDFPEREADTAYATAGRQRSMDMRRLVALRALGRGALG